MHATPNDRRFQRCMDRFGHLPGDEETGSRDANANETSTSAHLHNLPQRLGRKALVSCSTADVKAYTSGRKIKRVANPAFLRQADRIRKPVDSILSYELIKATCTLDTPPRIFQEALIRLQSEQGHALIGELFQDPLTTPPSQLLTHVAIF